MARKNLQQEYLVCGACNLAITSQQIANGKAKKYLNVTVHVSCPRKVLADIRQETTRVFSLIGEKMKSIKKWVDEVIRKIREITEEELWGFEMILSKAISQIREVLTVASAYKDQRTQEILHHAEKEILSIQNRFFFWKTASVNAL